MKIYQENKEKIEDYLFIITVLIFVISTIANAPHMFSPAGKGHPHRLRNQPDRQRDGRRLGRLPECLPDAVSHRRAEKISCRQSGFPPLMRRTSVLRSKTLKWAEFISDHLSPMKGLPPGSRSRWDTDLCGEQTGPQIVYGKRQGDRAELETAVSRHPHSARRIG